MLRPVYLLLVISLLMTLPLHSQLCLYNSIKGFNNNQDCAEIEANQIKKIFKEKTAVEGFTVPMIILKRSAYSEDYKFALSFNGNKYLNINTLKLYSDQKDFHYSNYKRGNRKRFVKVKYEDENFAVADLPYFNKSFGPEGILIGAAVGILTGGLIPIIQRVESGIVGVVFDKNKSRFSFYRDCNELMNLFYDYGIDPDVDWCIPQKSDGNLKMTESEKKYVHIIPSMAIYSSNNTSMATFDGKLYNLPLNQILSFPLEDSTLTICTKGGKCTEVSEIEKDTYYVLESYGEGDNMLLVEVPRDGFFARRRTLLKRK